MCTRRICFAHTLTDMMFPCGTLRAKHRITVRDVSKSFTWVEAMAHREAAPPPAIVASGTASAPAEGPPTVSQRDPRPNLVLFERLRNRTAKWSNEYLRFDWTCANI